MDSQERHELKENDLAEFFTNFGEWWSKYGNVVLLVLVLAAGGFAGYRLYNHWTYTRVHTAYGDLAGATTVQSYALVAEQHRQPTVQALAYLRGGDLALEQAVLPQQADEANEADETDDASATESMTPDEAVEMAQTMYSRALESATQPVYRANALLGLAQVAEMQSEWEQANSYYQQAEEIATAAHLSALAGQARRRQALIDQLRHPVVFAPESAAPDLPAMMPGVNNAADSDEAAFDFSEFAAPDDDQPTPVDDDAPTDGDAPAPADENTPAETE